LKLDHPEKTEWWYLYQCMGRIMHDLYRDPSRIQNAYEFGALEFAADKWKPSQTFFQKHPGFRSVDSVASRKQKLTRDFMTEFKDLHQQVFTKFSTIIFQALEVLISTLLLQAEVWALVKTVDLVIDDNQQQLVAIAARLFPVEFTQEPVIPIAEYICFAPQPQAFFHAYIRPTDPQDETWIPALTFFCRGVAVARPTMTKPTLISVRNTRIARLFDQHAWLVCPANIAGGVIGEHVRTHCFDSVHGRDKRWGLRSRLSPGSHLARVIPSP
jgi:hypothetical protein